MRTKRRRIPRVPTDLRYVLERLRAYRGQFFVGDDEEIRHKMCTTPPFSDIPACPLAYLCILDDHYVSNSCVESFVSHLGVSRESVNLFVNAADGTESPPHSSSQLAEVRRAIIR